MNTFSPSAFNIRFNSLDPKIKATITSLESADKIYAVCEKHEVSRRAFSYSQLLGFTLMGELNPNLLVKSIVEKENIDVEKAKAIALDLSAAILQPVKKELIAMYGLAPKPQTSTPPETPKPEAHKPIMPAPPPPSTRQEGAPLPSLPAIPLNSNPTPPTQNSKPLENTFYSPAPLRSFSEGGPAPLPNLSAQDGSTAGGNEGWAAPSVKPNVIDLSKEPPRPVAQPGDPPLEGNIVNLKNPPPSV